MRDITEEIKKAISSPNMWNISNFDKFVQDMAKYMQISYWENEENWASILNETLEVKGFIWRKYPLIVLEKGVDISIIQYLNEKQEISLLILNSLKEESLTIAEHFNQLNHYENNEFNFESFTMEDLWFYTNTI